MMDDATRDQVLEHLASILEQVQGVRADMIDVKARLQRVELAGVDLEQDVASLRKEVLRLDHRLDQLDERLAGLDGVGRPEGLSRRRSMFSAPERYSLNLWTMWIAHD